MSVRACAASVWRVELLEDGASVEWAGVTFPVAIVSGFVLPGCSGGFVGCLGELAGCSRGFSVTLSWSFFSVVGASSAEE